MSRIRRLYECGRTEILIRAPVPIVWGLLTDVEAWSAWMPTIRSVRRLTSGGFALGAKYEVRQPGLPDNVYRVTSVDAEKAFTWEATTAAATLVASHEVWPTSNGCAARSVYAATGLLAPVIRSLFCSKIARMLTEEADSLRRRAELRSG